MDFLESMDFGEVCFFVSNFFWGGLVCSCKLDVFAVETRCL